MHDIVHVLPDVLANQIAAGEVVQRPASVLKELLENSVDAGASDITVVVAESGKQMIRVVDNGTGMSVTDARMCLERHATSKIKSSDDLFNIRTMGFRGEAMASIAAVAQMDLKSRRESDELGTHICVEGAEVKFQEPVSMNHGTQVTVKNLFFNVPARRNFLKSNPVEMKHLLEEFFRVALAFPEIAFRFYQQDLLSYDLSSGKLSRRIVELYGKSYQDNLIPCSEETPLLSVKGYIGKPDKAKRTRGEQYFFINQRYIRNNYLHHAVMTAYEQLIDSDSYPFYVLFLEIDPQHIDVNVHPTKHEVKFDDERTVYGILKSTVKQALGSHNVSPSLDFSASVNLDRITADFKQSNRPSQDYLHFRNLPDKNPGDWEKLFEDENLSEIRISQVTQFNHDAGQSEIKLDSAANRMTEVAHDQQRSSFFQLGLQFIASPIKSGLLLIRQQAAHQRILYEKYLRELETRAAASQQLLFPQVVELNAQDFELVHEIADELRQLGFDFQEFGQSSYIVHGLPAETIKNETSDLFESLIEQFKLHRKELTLDRNEAIARALAIRTAVGGGTLLSEKEMKQIIDELFSCQYPDQALDKSRTYTILNFEHLRTYFK